MPPNTMHKDLLMSSVVLPPPPPPPPRTTTTTTTTHTAGIILFPGSSSASRQSGLTQAGTMRLSPTPPFITRPSRSIRQIIIFVLLMVSLTLFLLMKSVSNSDDGLVNDGGNNNLNENDDARPDAAGRDESTAGGVVGPIWRPLQQRILAWTGVAVPPPDRLPQRWYLQSNVTRIVSTEVLGKLNGLWPEDSPGSDRIEEQLLHKPVAASSNRPEMNKTRVIYVPEGLAGWGVSDGRDVFRRDNCPVDDCELTGNKDTAMTADAILSKHRFGDLKREFHPSSQIWILYLLESPFHTPSFSHAKGSINWTATYRKTVNWLAPYEKFVLHDPQVRENTEAPLDVAALKTGTGKVAWFVSNCGAANQRMNYAKELQKYIPVDIFGSCGDKKCGRNEQPNCRDMLRRDYKFYLAFEKFWVNALQSDILPIVMGAPIDDYTALAPLKSFIHVDQYGSPKELAEYLNILDQNATLYNEYFRWRGTGEFINTHFFCRLCSMLHSKRESPSHYEDVDGWWRGDKVCRKK
ncbi:Glycoprotein 3-alpha-L-fucosyltransferase A [Hypsibius exemplaris]|uniref:Fucosyltransferase n=1 Tax=Hypsibius exemplaris TaxID=2072580 RepID=A0A1W0WSD5_HYPEX|nr:Glycoprotein 3-alpha-L-fucosyltransferase A [Hypsibius exemplaris]